MKAVIYRQDRTTDARVIASGIREDFIKLKGRVTVLETVVPARQGLQGGGDPAHSGASPREKARGPPPPAPTPSCTNSHGS